jgi:hypothetical protein
MDSHNTRQRHYTVYKLTRILHSFIACWMCHSISAESVGLGAPWPGCGREPTLYFWWTWWKAARTSPLYIINNFYDVKRLERLWPRHQSGGFWTNGKCKLTKCRSLEKTVNNWANDFFRTRVWDGWYSLTGRESWLIHHKVRRSPSTWGKAECLTAYWITRYQLTATIHVWSTSQCTPVRAQVRLPRQNRFVFFIVFFLQQLTFLFWRILWGNLVIDDQR